MRNTTAEEKMIDDRCSLDCSDKDYPCKVFEGNYWNGWAIPYVTNEVALEILKDLSTEDFPITNITTDEKGTIHFVEDEYENDDDYADTQWEKNDDGLYNLLGYCWWLKSDLDRENN